MTSKRPDIIASISDRVQRFFGISTNTSPQREWEAEVSRTGPPRMWHHPRNLVWQAACIGKTSTDDDATPDDHRLVQRVEAAYALACTMPVLGDGGFWMKEFAAIKQPEHERLISRNAGGMLRDPANSRLFYGFDGLVKSLDSENVPNERLTAAITLDALLQLAAAVGVGRLDYPEAREPHAIPDTEALLERLDRAVGFRITFPNPFPREVGLATSRGIATYRCAQSIYQAWRIAALVARIPNARVLEIGPGLGRTAYYAFQLGLRDYTLVDIPLSSAAQGYFLGRTLGDDAISLLGETNSAPIKVAPPSHFLDEDDRFDLIVNVDSLTEMSRTVADRYWSRIQGAAPIFLSINHEYNSFSFRDMYVASGHLQAVTRSLYWMRRGYVEELVRLEPDDRR